MDSPFAIKVKDLKKRYGEVRAVDGLDLEINRGECFGLLGPNGAGKTTTIEILEGLTPPDSGLVEVLGQPWGTGKDHRLRERLGIQLQETQLAEKLTVTETVRLFRSFYRQGKKVEDVIATVELGEKSKARVGKLSGGQKQRLALACSLVSDPDLLFLDEPTTGLDPQARHQIWELIEAFHGKGGSVVITTHYMEEAARLCERVAIMDHGKVIALGSPSELIASLGADQVIEFSASNQLEDGALSALPGVTRVSRRNGAYLVSAKKAGDTLPAIFSLVESHAGRIDNLTTHEATLEDVFIALTGRALRDD